MRAWPRHGLFALACVCSTAAWVDHASPANAQPSTLAVSASKRDLAAGNGAGWSNPLPARKPWVVRTRSSGPPPRTVVPN